AFELGDYDQAIASLKKIEAIPFIIGFDANYVGTTSAIIPKKLYLLGKVYQAKGDIRQAAENYDKFLTLWKNADPELPEVIDAKKQLAELKAKGV
ncbi:MAG: tol-pal system YbgF family protein, partial [Calditrichia bacterium]